MPAQGVILPTIFCRDGKNVIKRFGKVIQYGQQFTNGLATPDIQRYSGEIIYVDNRAPITRSSSQKEELKIVVEF